MSKKIHEIGSLEDIQKVTTENIIKNIEHSQLLIDNLIQSSENVHELRNFRKKSSILLSELRDKNLGKFNEKTSDNNDFTSAEERLNEAAGNLIAELEKQSNEKINIKSIAILLDTFEHSIKSRLNPTSELKKQISDIEKSEESHVELLSSNVKNELHLFLNMLQTKYSRNRPEILFGGDYIKDLNWKYFSGDDFIKARLDSVLENPLVFEAHYQKKEHRLIDQIQITANKVKKNQHKCLCLINESWDEETKDFASRFVHPNFVLYLHDLESGLVFNTENRMAVHYAFWFNTELGMNKLDELANDFIDVHEYFIEDEVAKAFGLNIKGAKKLLKGLVDNGIIFNVNFESEKNKKYTKIKPKD